MRLLAAALVVVALAGCGGSAVGKAETNQAAALDKLAMDEAYGAMLKDAGQPARITVDLNRYGRSARAWASEIGHDKAVRKLADDASAIQPVCADCASWIDRIRATL
jgi:hypothetical protein